MIKHLLKDNGPSHSYCIKWLSPGLVEIPCLTCPTWSHFIQDKLKRGSFMVWEINMGVCPCLEFDNIMFINFLGYDFYIYGAFEFLCNSIANL